MNRPIHFEILAREPAELGKFYESVFGWTVASLGSPEQGYWLVKTGPAEAPGIDGGMMHRHFEQAVINTIQVDDVAVAVSQVESAGGRTLTEPRDIPGVGLHAYCADPEGNLFGLLQRAM